MLFLMLFYLYLDILPVCLFFLHSKLDVGECVLEVGFLS